MTDKLTQEEFNVSILRAVEGLTNTTEGINGLLAMLMIRVCKLEGTPVPPDLMRIGVTSYEAFLEGRKRH